MKYSISAKFQLQCDSGNNDTRQSKERPGGLSASMGE